MGSVGQGAEAVSMNRTTRAVMTLGGVGVLATLGVAVAQPGAEPRAVDQLLAVPEVAQMSPEQMTRELEATQNAIGEIGRSIDAQLGLAREKRDVVKVLCLSDKLTQLNMARESITARGEELLLAQKGQNRARAEHEMAMILVMRNRGREIAAEANFCVGEEIGHVGESDLSMDIDPTLPEDQQLGEPPPEGGIFSSGAITEVNPATPGVQSPTR